MTGGIPNLDELHQFSLDLFPNEASGLLAIENDGLLGEHGWDRAFWVCLDEGPVTDCIALVGHRADSPDDDLASGWEIARLRAIAVGDARSTEDAEGLARKDGYVYVIGSCFGSKRGPLQPKRGFVARFPEAEVCTPRTSRRPRSRSPARASSCTASSTMPSRSTAST